MGTYSFAGAAPALSAAGVRNRSWPAAAATVVSGVAIVAGALLPWITLFANLYPYRGIIGLNGRLMLAGGVLAIAGGVWLFIRDSLAVRRVLGVLGFVLLASALWLLKQQYSMYHELLTNQPMSVPGIGPGLFVASAGALLLALVTLGSFRSGTARRQE